MGVTWKVLHDMEIASFATSIIAVVISAGVAGWTIYRDAIQRPKFQVSIATKNIHQAGRPTVGPDIYVEALNLGPLPNRLGVVNLRKSWWQRRIKGDTIQAVINPNDQHVAASHSGKRIEVGDREIYVFPYNVDCFLKEDWAQAGVFDGYGRMHWAPRKQLRLLRKKYHEDFSQEILPED